MKIGKVIGSVWATRKAGCLSGHTFLVVDTGKEDLVAADQVGAGMRPLMQQWWPLWTRENRTGKEAAKKSRLMPGLPVKRM